MRKSIYRIILLSAILCLPSFSYATTIIKSPDKQKFATPTSDETQYIGTNDNTNVNRSKNSAYIPPVFGTPTAYIPNRCEFLTPNLATQVYYSTYVPSIYNSVMPQNTSEKPIKKDISYTKVTDDLYYSNDRIGTLKIPELDLSVKVYEGTDEKTLAKGVGHFSETSIWNGNVVIGGHNRGTNNYFGKIHTLSLNDKITFTTKLGTRTYKVYSIQKISNKDFTTPLERTAENILTLITCVKNESSYRWCIKAKEI